MKRDTKREWHEIKVFFEYMLPILLSIVTSILTVNWLSK